MSYPLGIVVVTGGLPTVMIDYPAERQITRALLTSLNIYFPCSNGSWQPGQIRAHT